jgi:hypothetical protein
MIATEGELQERYDQNVGEEVIKKAFDDVEHELLA